VHGRADVDQHLLDAPAGLRQDGDLILGACFAALRQRLLDVTDLGGNGRHTRRGRLAGRGASRGSAARLLPLLAAGCGRGWRPVAPRAHVRQAALFAILDSQPPDLGDQPAHIIRRLVAVFESVFDRGELVFHSTRA
jgi:hypothetical protein